MPVPTNGKVPHLAPMSDDSTETALIGLIRQSMQENTAVTRDGFDRMGEGLDKMATSMRTLFQILGVAFILMTAGLITVVGGAAYVKAFGIEVNTHASTPAEDGTP